MTPDYLHQRVLPAAYALLPSQMQSPNASAMLLTIALQESRCCHRRQISGPARGFWQFEITGVRGVLAHKATKAPLANALDALSYPVTDDATVPYVAIEHNDVLAAVCARLLLWTLPDALPPSTEPAEGYELYIKAWRPGKPHPETWAEYYRQAWEITEV